jgi:hypothetical protein
MDSTNLPPGVRAANSDPSWPLHVTVEIDTTALNGKGRIETDNNGVIKDFSLKKGDHAYHLPDLYPDGTGLHMTIGAVEASTFTIPKLKFTFVYYTFS